MSDTLTICRYPDPVLRTKAQSLAWPAQTLPDTAIKGYRNQILPLLQHDSGKKTH